MLASDKLWGREKPSHWQVQQVTPPGRTFTLKSKSTTSGSTQNTICLRSRVAMNQARASTPYRVLINSTPESSKLSGWEPDNFAFITLVNCGARVAEESGAAESPGLFGHVARVRRSKILVLVVPVLWLAYRAPGPHR